MVHLLKTKKELKHLQEVQIRFTKMVLLNLVFQHDMAYSKFEDLAERIQSDKVIRDKAFEIASNPKYDGYQGGLAWMVYKFLDKKSAGSGIKNEIKQNQQFTNELHKPIIRKFKGRIFYSSFKDNISGVELADMQLISKYNKGIRFLLCAFNHFSKYAWVVPIKEQKRVTMVDAFPKILDDSRRKPNEIWVDQGSEF